MITSATALSATTASVRTAYVVLPGIGEAYAERNGTYRGATFFGTDADVQSGSALTLFAGNSKILINRPNRKTITRAWLVLAAPVLVTTSLVRTFLPF